MVQTRTLHLCTLHLARLHLARLHLSTLAPSTLAPSTPAPSAPLHRPLPMLPAVIPIFPLPNVVLFPGVFLPLHIFEPRYRAMTRDALAEDRIIGISLLQPGFEADYEGRPPVYPIGCAGVISHSARLEDGRFNLVLHGLAKYRIVEELQGGDYRRARIDMMTEPVTAEDRDMLERRRPRLESVLVDALKAAEMQIPDAVSDVDLVHALCQYLQFSPAERQALLECDTLSSRGNALIELLEMQALLARHPGAGSPGLH